MWTNPFTHVKKGAGLLQYELTGVGFVLTVIHVNMKLVSLERTRTGEEIKKI